MLEYNIEEVFRLKKYITIMILFLMLFAPLFSINAKDVIEAQSIPKRIYEEVENGAINESSSFANIVIFIKFADETSYSNVVDRTNNKRTGNYICS